jgi:hypothetical protein
VNRLLKPLARSLAVLLLVGLARTASAACAPDGFTLYPAPGSVLPVDARLVLEGRGPDAARVERLVGHSLVLRSEDDAVSVRVTRGWKSLLNRTAVVLRPSRALRPNRVYFLDARALGDNLDWLDGPKHGNPSWRIGEGSDEAAPRWQHRPEVSEGEVAVRDGKVVRTVTVHAVVKDQSPVYLVVTLRPKRGGTGAQVYFAPLDGAEAVIGHDGCTGSFALEDNGLYRGTAQAYDITGASSAPAEFDFQSPGQSAEDR